MKHISILAPIGNAIVDTIIAPYNLLRMANKHYKRITETIEDHLKIDLVGLTLEPVQYNGLFQVSPTRTIYDNFKTDLIIVSAIDGNLEKAVKRNKNFIIYLIEKYCGRETSIWCSKVSEIELDRNDQSHFIIFKGQKEHDDDLIKQAQVFIENNFEDRINIDEIAKMVNISNRNFLRRFKKATSNTPSVYIQRVKVEAAKKKLESSTLNIQEVMYGVGYSDEKAFRNTFKKFTGLSPLEYRSKYNREMALS